MSDGITPLRKWEPEVGERVVEWREPEMVGVVIRCDRYGHVGDPCWRASVRWLPGGGVSHGIETSNLTREDGTQGQR